MEKKLNGVLLGPSPKNSEKLPKKTYNLKRIELYKTVHLEIQNDL
jgi:hypothetical protein